MLQRLAFAGGVLAVLMGCGSPAAAADASAIVRQAVDGFVRPAYAELAVKAGDAEKGIEALCGAPSQQALNMARAEFAGLIDAWSSVEIIRFGPITEDNRLERMLYWPDRKSIGLKQVQAALARKDQTAADSKTLAGKSVAMQGLGALEFVLYGTGAEALAGKDDPYRCAYAAAIAGNIEAISASVTEAWAKPDGFAALWANPGPDNPVYRNGAEAITELVGVFINGLELVRDQRLKSFLGADPDADKPKSAVFWRSGLTGAALGANLDGMDRLFRASHIADALNPDSRWIAESIHIQLANGAADGRAASGPIDEVLAHPARRAKLDHFALVTSSLSTLFGVRLSGEFGLSAGFSSLDGD
ncbi:peptidase M75, Imelysin [Mesorhizobium sp. Root554]|nr:peptidase M75, Imelysin [Mesorhizobium sp. Root1471]KQZ37783.1 peptidase M75, Imelysin [Mesorhizobium sp. Root554]